MMEDTAYYEVIHNALGKALTLAPSVMRDVPGATLVTKWVVVMELVDDQGDKCITGFRGPTPNSCPIWDAHGLMRYAIDNLEPISDDEDED